MTAFKVEWELRPAPTPHKGKHAFDPTRRFAIHRFFGGREPDKRKLWLVCMALHWAAHEFAAWELPLRLKRAGINIDTGRVERWNRQRMVTDGYPDYSPMLIGRKPGRKRRPNDHLVAYLVRFREAWVLADPTNAEKSWRDPRGPTEFENLAREFLSVCGWQTDGWPNGNTWAAREIYVGHVRWQHLPRAKRGNSVQLRLRREREGQGRD